MQVLQGKLQESKKLDWQYFAKDSKDSKPCESDTTKLLTREYQLLVGSVRNIVGLKPMQITLRIPFTLTATVTTGVVNTTVSMVPGSSGEFSSLAAIFNEYKCHSGEIEFVSYLRSLYAIGAAAATLNSSALALVYDADSTALTSVIGATEYLQHKLYPVGQQAASGALPMTHETLKFPFRVTPGIGTDTVSGSVESGQWSPTSSSTATYGFIKSYFVGAEVTAIAVVQGVAHLHCEFRIRE
jgi:hypothetical protein